jgi:para-nitrobenzyl esterase
MRITGLIVTSLAALALAGGAVAGGPPKARLETGSVSGLARNGAEAFLGVPYAASPTGPRRWAPPAPATAWTGARRAIASGPACPALPSGDGPRSEAEDCLYLNIYRPGGARPGARLPVMLFIHGGGNISGSAGVYDGGRMAKEGRALVVIPGYRIGVFGALAPPAAGAEGGGYTLLDLIAALQWVKRNAAALGGDPADVTIFGQSAGGGNVCALLASPKAAGLFAHAIIESSGCGSRRSLAQAQGDARRLAEALGCPDEALACLRRQPAGKALDAWAGLGVPSAPPHGTDVLPEDPAAAIAAGRFNRVPVLFGFTRDEWWPFQHALYPLDAAGLARRFAARFGDRAEAVAARYPAADFPHLEYALGAAEGDQRIICPTLALAATAAAYAPVSVEEFADRSTPPFRSLGPPQPIPPGYSPGAFHTAELQFLLDYRAALRPLDGAQRARGDAMIRDWVGFGRGGRWPAAADGVRVYDEGGAHTAPVADRLRDHRCDLWSR